MRMAELSARSGVSIATIKYYLREGLLPPGELTSPNQARYDEAHVRRLKLVRALLEIGGMSLADVRDVLDAVDHQTSTHQILGVAQHGLPTPKMPLDDEDRAWALAKLEPIAEAHGWHLRPGDPLVESLLGTVAAFEHLGRTELLDTLPDYAELAERMGELDVGVVAELPSTESIVEGAVVGTVLGDALFAALRRIAQRKASEGRFTP
ncbi:MerR family transcriptional regulator [Amycolatopsis sp. GM8]|uniref:MerR family transcriptional regulator n=1 Tax=Amycolatopsis sp. GM8 TaxID=2896530 RepID=UPI001F00A9B6|nr:MerR family transcriptional regulator [Amycolatopsis sp. GM8]